MDSVISSALEEICSYCRTGIKLLHLWEKLLPLITASGLDLSVGVKQVIWSNLIINVQGLQFRHRDNDEESYCSSSIQSVQGAEKLNLRILANEQLRDCFFGLYDLKAREGLKGVSAHENRILERLALARSNGITQSELAKEFGMDGNQIFYHVKQLESQGLIKKQQIIVRIKGVSNESGVENNSAVNTSMLYLHRYAKNLGSLQRLEITKKDEPLESLGNTNALSSDISGEHDKEDVHVKDFFPELKAICDKLDEAEKKVLVVRDIKQALGYRDKSGQRAWRNICQTLKDAHIVEELKPKVDNKVVPCLRLLKKFSPDCFESKTHRYRNDSVVPEQAVNVGKRGQITDQVVELSIDHQIYDLIDAAGSKGLTIIEVCKMLGINSKRYNDRLLRMFSRFGMDLRQEVHNKATGYRVWTSRNADPSTTALSSTLENAKNENRTSQQHIEDPDFQEVWDLTATELCPSTSQKDTSTCKEMKNKETEVQYSHGSSGDGKRNVMSCVSNPQELVHTSSCTATDNALALVTVPAELNISPCKTSCNASTEPHFIPRYPCPTMTELGAQRVERILNKLQEEKFIIRPELQRWLESFETHTSTKMDRKTLIRILNKLQEQGQCKCINVSVPVVSNCGSSRTKEVILHPSFQNLTPALYSQIQDKLRSFEMRSRGFGLSQLKDDLFVPELNGIQKVHTSVAAESQAVRSEALRTNGFVLAKMVRAKLLHSFLWNYLSTSPGWDGILSSGLPGYDKNNPHSTCILFELDVAIKAIPLELFLQVVGSTAKFDDLIGKCKSGLRLSDLPVIEYKSLMDTLARGRLSFLIDILRRLKLIRLVSNANSDGEDKARYTTYKNALELKPYIEEPKTILPSSSGFSSLDLRPQIRHDFCLLEREAVDDYWRTLEYCYSAADPAAALHAFPGSAVNEVFIQRSWASARVMTAEQRSELLKRLVEEDSNKKLSFKECEKIAKDLNLTLQQVLRYYYDRRNQRLNRFQGGGNVEGNTSRSPKRKRNSSSRKRNRGSEGNSSNATDGSVKKFCKQKLAHLSGFSNHFTEEYGRVTTSSRDQGIIFEASEEQTDLEDIENPGPSMEEDNSSFRRYHTSSGISQTRQKKILWTEKKDRQLIIEYVRHRARLGANFHRAVWVSLPNLPAPPDCCKRRMASLQRNTKFRKSLMTPCNMLGERYANHLDKTKTSDGFDDQDSEYFEQWDDFDDDKIKKALEEVLRIKRMVKFQSSREDRLGPADLSELNLKADPQQHPCENELVGDEFQNDGHCRDYGQSSSSRHLPLKFLKHLTEERTVSKRIYNSLAVSNAVELLKLVFLNGSTAKEVPNLLAETLRRYSEHDLLSALSYLREKKIMIGGSSGSAFSLSKRFVNNIHSSPFQPDTGKRVTEFSRWLEVNKAVVEEEGISLTEDLRCGETFHLFALVALEELSIAPCLLDEGVGDTEDTKSLKRKPDNAESRQEKGFPALKVSLSSGALSRANTLEILLEEKNSEKALSVEEVDRSSSFSGIWSEDGNFTSAVPPAGVTNESLWEAMASYAKHLMLGICDEDQFTPINSELFRIVWLATQKAGDQGLSMEQVVELVEMQGALRKELPRLIIEVLERFGQAVKVNAYNSVHVVDSLYSPKYLLTSLAWLNQEHQPTAMIKSNEKKEYSHLTQSECVPADPIWEVSTKSDNSHRVTILNFTEEVDQTLIEGKSKNELEGCSQEKVVSPGGDHSEKSCESLFGGTRPCMPILPWINGDGTINMIVYQGLIRRVLGTVMQNPGILEDDIIRQIDTLNPQSCRKLLELMILDKHLIVRKMHQTTSGAPPSLMTSLLGKKLKAANSIYPPGVSISPYEENMQCFNVMILGPLGLLMKTGEICLDILKNAWSPAWTLQSVCRAIIALMAHPEPDSPLNCDSGNLLRSGDLRGYQSMAKMYTRLAAIPKKS